MAKFGQFRNCFRLTWWIIVTKALCFFFLKMISQPSCFTRPSFIFTWFLFTALMMWIAQYGDAYVNYLHNRLHVSLNSVLADTDKVNSVPYLGSLYHICINISTRTWANFSAALVLRGLLAGFSVVASGSMAHTSGLENTGDLLILKTQTREYVGIWLISIRPFAGQKMSKFKISCMKYFETFNSHDSSRWSYQLDAE